MFKRGLQGSLARSKVSGPGRRVRWVFFYVSTSAWLCCADWLNVGFEIVTDPDFADPLRDHLLPLPNHDFSGCRRRPANYVEMAALFLRLYLLLTVPEWDEGKQSWQSSKVLLLVRLLAGFFSLHSPRNWLVSWAAVFGIGPERRKYCGRWAVIATDEYCRTAKEMVHEVQETVAQALRSRDHRFTEEAAFMAARQYMLDQGATNDFIEQALADLDCSPHLQTTGMAFGQAQEQPGSRAAIGNSSIKG